MNVFPITQLMQQLPVQGVSPEIDEATVMRCMQMLGNFNGSAMGLVGFEGQTGWECHPGGDELLYYLEGEAELCIIAAEGDVRHRAKRGDVVQIPKGLWHSQRTLSPVRLFFITPVSGLKNAAERPTHHV